MFQYMEPSEIKENDLKKTRVDLGLSITDLSRLSNVSTKVISQTERMLIDPTRVTKTKIIKGLNAAKPEGEKKIEYTQVFKHEKE